MPGMNWEELRPQERLVAEQAVLNLRALNQACRSAADGKVLAVAETLAMQQGREWIRKSLQMSLEHEGREAEKKGARPDLLLRIEQGPSWLQTTPAHHSCGRHFARASRLPLCAVPGWRICCG